MPPFPLFPPLRQNTPPPGPQVKHKDKLNPECGQEVFRQQLEADDDIRLNRPLFQKCLADKKQYCADVAPGHAAVRDCLVEHRGEPGFSQPCRLVCVCVGGLV